LLESQASERRNDSRGVRLGDHDLDVDDVLGPESGHRSRTQTRDQIREAIVTKGWSNRAKAFTQSFGSDELDASKPYGAPPVISPG
jgi:hypothetical protein